MTHEQLQKLEALEQAATKGPWRASNIDKTIGPFFYIPDSDGDKVYVDGWNVSGPLSLGNNESSAFAEADARFIAEARNAMPGLLAELRRLRGFAAAVQPIIKLARDLAKASANGTAMEEYAKANDAIMEAVFWKVEL